jgi:dolichol-phosphate mannosyltransferase
VVVPTYDERENLEPLVEQILSQREGIEVLIVDDASPDGTGELADRLAAQDARVGVIHRPAKSGLGSAYREGLQRALDRGADVIVQMDADFSHPPATLPDMLDTLEDCDVVIGSRYLKGITVVNWPIERILISWFGNWYARKVTGLPLTDTTSGFRAMRRSALEAAEIGRSRADGYAFQIELNFRLLRRGARVREIPFLFLDRTRGESKLSPRIGLEAIWMVWWLRFAAWIGRL